MYREDGIKEKDAPSGNSLTMFDWKRKYKREQIEELIIYFINSYFCYTQRKMQKDLIFYVTVVRSSHMQAVDVSFSIHHISKLGCSIFRRNIVVSIKSEVDMLFMD